ncbi:M20/M25/M40 family metallo-hydrolase [Niabella beijingensis]|uniref:M20/M25/M40 family metallo-hydrolase n=1 Tax=Niabella beijingensis TaxID=2872700 RepID=UPI001CBD54D4|nr:M20/M25/M40 family metallo-hydrolase [Niabella beijingensis]MBZ4187769.1 M20/M25/M40 family metallo-hydrolase [Niabella beijingensis]
MRLRSKMALAVLFLGNQFVAAQPAPASEEHLLPVVEKIINEATGNSQLEKLASELLDGIGPRLVGTPEMEKASDWAIASFEKWGISGSRQQFGEWRGWQRGSSQVELTAPRIKSLEATQLAWSPATKTPVQGEVIVLPYVTSPQEFTSWLAGIKGKIVLMAQYQRSGRPDYQIKEFATPELYEKMMKERADDTEAFRKRIANTGYNNSTLPEALEKAGAAAIAISNWTGIMGANRIFGARTKKIPTIDISVEDYGMLYRMAVNGQKPRIRINVQSKELGMVKTFNTIGRIEGKEKPNEYVILSAHFDSWDGAQGATDNGTGTITMMETLRILKKLYPNNKRTILVCLWGSEEQGLNGSRAFVKDNPEIVKNIQAVFNQDNGTGRIASISGQGFVNAYDYLGRWLTAAPKKITSGIETSFPGMPGGGGSDHASFVAAGVPSFMLGSLSWGYGGYTWHTNRDTYDKIVFDEVRNNVILTAILAYMASEDPELASREKRVLPAINGQPAKWPEVKEPERKGGADQ